MQKFSLFPIILFVLFFSTMTFAQNPSPTPTPNTDDTDVVKISTTLIQIDATVTDKKGNVVRNLKPEDFEIYENGKKQEITNFSFVSLDSQKTPADAANSKTDKNTVSLPPVKLKPEQVRRTYAIVVDDLGLSFASSYFVKNSLKKFINEQIQDGDLVAVIRTQGGIGTLQSFTSNRQQLLAAVNKIRWTMNNSKVGDFDPVRENPKGMGYEIVETDNGSETQAVLDQVQAFRQNSVSIGTLGALKFIVNGMKNIPGRKSVILLSEGFNLYDQFRSPSPGGTTGSSIAGKAVRTGNIIDSEVYSQLRILTELANRESITFYPIDPRGLTVSMPEAADDFAGKVNFGNFDVRNAGGPGAVAGNRENALRGSQDSLEYLARQTGGVAYINRNDINLRMQNVLDDQSGYYLLGYQPDEETFDVKKSKFNKLTVKVKKDDLRVRYRTGFFGITDEKLKSIPQTSQQQLNAALTSPFGTSEINLDLYSVFADDDKSKNYIRSFVHIDTKNLDTTKAADGSYQGNYELVAVAFGDNGIIVDQVMKNYKFKVDEKSYRQFLDKGFIYDLILPVKKSGAYQLRVAVRDTGSGKVGSASQFVEVPDIGKKNLTLSNIIVKNYSMADWKKITANQGNSSENSNFFRDATIRQFRRGTILAYTYIIYNAKPDSIRNQKLQIQTKLFYNGKLFLQSQPQSYKPQGQVNSRRFEVSDIITLGTDLQPGDYALQIVVSEDEKNKFAAQSVDFEIVK